ncbi:MAG: hypothetical protein Satyrvirus17_23, partial [Satyrvirus sp.]
MLITALLISNGSKVKVVAKNSLKYIPLIGYIFRFFEIIFIKRKIAEDKKILTKSAIDSCN